MSEENEIKERRSQEIEGGKVCEKGRHAELMEQDGKYRKLVKLSGGSAMHPSIQG